MTGTRAPNPPATLPPPTLLVTLGAWASSSWWLITALKDSDPYHGLGELMAWVLWGVAGLVLAVATTVHAIHTQEVLGPLAWLLALGGGLVLGMLA